MSSTPDTPDYEFAPAVHNEPYWLNTPRTCRYLSEVGMELGHVQLGEGSACNIWFSYIGNNTKPITPGGRFDREAAKDDVVRAIDLDVDLIVAEQEYQRERRRQR